MVFDNKFVTTDVERWQIKRNPKRLERILEKSKGLVEAIVSTYDPSLREDMIQAAYIKLIRACDLFDVSKGTPLHTYFTTVIHNSCRTVLRTESKHLEVFSEQDDEDEIDDSARDVEIELDFIIEYCRKRFPFVDPNTVDCAVDMLMNHISVNGMRYHKQQCLSLAKELKIDSKQIETLYKVIIILLRYTHIEDVLFKLDENGNISTTPFMPELTYVLGENNAVMLSIIFDGIPIRF